MRHNIFYVAIQDIAQFIYGIHFYILIMAKSVQLGTVHMITSVQIILSDSLRPVSYTHLDVYKRQVERDRISAKYEEDH